MYKSVSSRVDFPKMEAAILEMWQKGDIFKRSVEARKGGEGFLLYDGPPTVNGSPALHHVFMSVFKDVIPRYKGHARPAGGTGNRKTAWFFFQDTD